MSRRFLPASLSGFARCALIAAGCASFAPVAAAQAEGETIRLELSPRVCTLSANDETCDTTVTAQWTADQEQSLCLLIIGHPQIKRCWEDLSEGTYTVRLVFSQDLRVELRDPQLQNVLATEAVAVIREALRLRRKRRQPWDILS